MTTTKKQYPQFDRWYVMTYKRTTANGGPTAQCGPFKTSDEALVAQDALDITDDDSLHVAMQNLNRMAIHSRILK